MSSRIEELVEQLSDRLPHTASCIWVVDNSEDCSCGRDDLENAIVQEFRELAAHAGKCSLCGYYTCGFCGMSVQDGNWECYQCRDSDPVKRLQQQLAELKNRLQEANTHESQMAIQLRAAIKHESKLERELADEKEHHSIHCGNRTIAAQQKEIFRLKEERDQLRDELADIKRKHSAIAISKLEQQLADARKEISSFKEREYNFCSGGSFEECIAHLRKEAEFWKEQTAVFINEERCSMTELEAELKRRVE